MFATMAKFELKNLIREKMTMVMFIYPLLLGGIVKYLIETNVVEGQMKAIIAIMLSLMAGFAYGAMAGFSLLDDRDDQVLVSIQISPIPLALYVWFKVLFITGLAVLAGFFLIWYIGVVIMTTGEILLVSILSALQVPTVTFLINAFAKNKVEGFVTMKAVGFLLLFPVGSFFFLDAKEWLFAIGPGHWAAKAVQYSMYRPMIEAGLVKMNLNFYQYLGIGALYNILVVIAAYRFFARKNNLL